MADRPAGAPTDYLAAERTFLAWIRTGLALMGFGFVVARFGLFLQSLQIVQANLQVRPYGPSFWFGTTLIVLGVVVNVVAARNHIRLVNDLKRGESTFARPSSLAVCVAVFLAALGLGLAIYLVMVREPSQEHLTPKEKASQERTFQEKASQEKAFREKTMATSNSGNGIVTISSDRSVDDTVQKLQDVLQSKGIKLFALVDHSGEAAKAGMQMRPTKLLIFGNPKAGTPLMIASPSIAIDLPLKILVSEDADGKVWVSYNSPGYLQSRHALPPELVQNISVVEALATKVAE